MEPILLGVIALVGAPAVAATARWFRGRQHRQPEPPPQRLPATSTTIARDGIRVGDVLTYLGDTYWLSGELSLKREGSGVLRLFIAPEKGRDRWLALPRDGQSVWVLETSQELAAMGLPGVELPLSGRVLRRTEHGNVAIEPLGESTLGWEGLGRFAIFRGHDRVAVFVEGADRKRVLGLEGREIPRQLVQKIG
jgi:hypothetical protein